MKKIYYLMLSSLLTFILLISACSPPPPTGKLILNKVQFKPGEEIKINYTAEGSFGEKPWIGIVPSNVVHGSEEENDANDLSYQYFDGLNAGEMIFIAPEEPGSYDFRMNTADGDGIEVTSVTFTVVAPPPPLKSDALLLLNKSEFEVGEEIIVSFSAPEEFEDNAWIGIVPSNTPHGSEATNDGADLAYQYLNKRTNGELKFTAPLEPGSYDMRMHDKDNDGKEVASKSFVVK